MRALKDQFARIRASFENNWLLWAIAGLCTVVLPTLVLFGVAIPRWAWKSELDGVDKRLEVQQLSTKINLLEDQSERLTLRKYETLRIQDQLRRSKEPVPDFYPREQTIIDTKLTSVQTELQQARDRTLYLSTQQ